MKVIILDTNKIEIEELDSSNKYIFIINDDSFLKKYNFNVLKVKPILILYNGAYIIDLEKNHVIIDRTISDNSLKKVLEYAKSHDVFTYMYKNRDKIYEIKMTTNNYHRKLIIPMLFKDKIPDVKCIVQKDGIYVLNRNVSLLNAIQETYYYLKIDLNLFELDNIYVNVSDIGYYQKQFNLKEVMVYEN